MPLNSQTHSSQQTKKQPMNSHVDTTEITHVSLCAGYGGIDLGLRRVLPNLRTIAYSEVETFAVENLLARMEGGQLDPAPVWSDLRTFPWDQFSGLVDIVSGGFPCQPFSSAGKRAGDEDERHLFPYILEGIKRCRPAIVLLENVEGILSAKLAGDNWRDPAGTPVLLHVFRELERVGYNPTAGIFSASECGAPHQRKRIFIMAHRNDTGLEGCGRFEQIGLSVRRKIEDEHRQAIGDGQLWPSRPGQPQHEWEPPRVVGNAERAERGKIIAGRDISNRNDAGREEETDRTGAPSELGNAEGQTSRGLFIGEDSQESKSGFYGKTILGNASEQGFPFSGGESRPLGKSRPQSEPERSDESVGHSEDGNQSGDALQLRPGKTQHRGASGSVDTRRGQTQSKVVRDADGLASGMGYAELSVSCDNRTDELRLLGNGVVPATAALAFQTLINQ